MIELTQQDIDARYMRMAIDAALVAEENGDVPIGTVIVHEGRLVAKAYNQREQLQDPTAHAESIVLRQAAMKLGRWRLSDATVYVTMEPCLMCAGALVLARVNRLVYGCRDERAGALGSVYDVVRDGRLNHVYRITPGILEAECRAVVQGFFEKLREK
jgi:tRNA(adenine34) deaminase